jgi:branched-chain amino acid transport system substrate-binding protein
MRLQGTRWIAGACIAVTALVTAACAPSTANSGSSESSAGSSSGGSTITVGVITSETGPLAAYGQEYLDGFKAGLDYATNGTGEVNGTKIVVKYGDDGADPDKAVQLAKEDIGQGINILMGTVSSGVALSMAQQAEQNKVLYISGPAAADAITGVNRYTFRSGRQSYQDVAAAASFVPDIAGKKVVVFAQDNAFGQGNAAAVDAVLGAKGLGATVDSVLVGEDIKDFTSFAKQIVNKKPDLVFVAWAGDTTGAMWQALEQQGVFDVAPVVTGLANSGTFGAYGPVASKISFLSHYFPAAPDNKVNDAMVAAVKAAGSQADLFTPDGFVGAQMLVHAISEGNGNVDQMISALEGWTFDGPKGSETIRASDHALLQDMYQANLVDQDGTWVPQLVKVVPADQVAPPEAG